MMDEGHVRATKVATYSLVARTLDRRVRRWRRENAEDEIGVDDRERLDALRELLIGAVLGAMPITRITGSERVADELLMPDEDGSDLFSYDEALQFYDIVRDAAELRDAPSAEVVDWARDAIVALVHLRDRGWAGLSDVDRDQFNERLALFLTNLKRMEEEPVQSGEGVHTFGGF